MNFVLQNGGAFAIGTAGHCVNSVGESVVLLTVAPGGANPVLVDIGTVIARHKTASVMTSHSYPSDRSSTLGKPDLGVIAGPCGGYYGSGPETVAHHGHGLVIGTGGTPRRSSEIRAVPSG
jgi:hypothetical protein